MNSCLLRALVAVLPLLGFSLEARGGLVYGVVGAGLFLVAVFWFLLVRPLLPRSVERVGYFLFLLGLVVAAEKIFSSSHLLLVSLFLLSPPELFQRRKRWDVVASQAVLISCFFFIFLAVHGAVAEGLGLKAGIPFFRHPAGSYFLVGFTLAGFSGKRNEK